MKLSQIATTFPLLLLLPVPLVIGEDSFDDPTIQVVVEPPALIATRMGVVLHKLADGSLFVDGNRSTDGGKTWVHSPAAVRASFHDQWKQTTGCVLRDGTYIGLGSQVEFPKLDQRILKVYRSTDNLETMEGPFDAPLNIPRGTGGYSETGEYEGGVWVDHGMIERADGTLITTCYGYWEGDQNYSYLHRYVPELKIYKYRTWVIGSTDGGKSWEVQGGPGYWPHLGPEGMCEPGLTELAGGDLLMVMRNGEWGEPIFQTLSSDGGETWSKPEKLPASGVWPTPCMMSNGLLVVGVGRSESPNFYLWVSPDGRGESWTSRTLVTKGGKGYASVIEIAPNLLLYSGYNKEKRALEVWRIQVERLHGEGE